MIVTVKESASQISERRLEQLYDYAKVIQWGRKNPTKFCEMFFGIEFLDNQKYTFMNSWITPNNIWCQSRNSGKALDIMTPIPTRYGWTKMRDVKVGMVILDRKGQPTVVKYVSPIFYNHTCYELTFMENKETGRVSKIVADADHIWAVSENQRVKLQNMTTRELYKELHKNIDNSKKRITESKKIKTRFYVPVATPLHEKQGALKHIVSIEKTKSVPTRCIKVDNEEGLFLCGRDFTVTHNTTVIAPFVMAKTVLFPKMSIYIMSKVGSQSQESFSKIEKIAKKEIDSFKDLTDVFLGELEVNKTDSSGFIHNPSSWYFKTLGAATVNSLNSKIDNLRGKRSNLNIYDEAGFIAKDMFDATMPFIAQDSDFALGKDVLELYAPEQIPNQVLMASSASDMSSVFYTYYKDWGKRMLMGDKRYFVADIDANIVKNATYNGATLKTPLITQKTIDDAMRTNKEKALREYYNKFLSDGGDEQPFKRSVVNKSTYSLLPEVRNIDNKSLYVLAYDPARQIDNSIVLGAKLYEDEKNGYMMDLVYGYNFIDTQSEKKRQLRYPEQEAFLRKKIIDFNGIKTPEYMNIHCVAIDSGAGGSGRHIGDNLMENWTDDKGHLHIGIIDPEEHKEYEYRFPDADKKLKLLSPRKLKAEMFEALEAMLIYGLIRFPEDYDGYMDSIKILKDIKLDNPYTYNDEEGNIVTTDIEQKLEVYELTKEEKISLLNITMAKEEMYKIRRSGTRGNYKYDLSPDLASSSNDDRAYCMAMLGWILSEVRKESKGENTNQNNSNEMLNIFKFRQPKVYGL